MIQRLETRDHVMVLLTEIVELFATAGAQKRLFANDVVLKALLYNLYGVLLDAVRELISVLLRTYKGNCESL